MRREFGSGSRALEKAFAAPIRGFALALAVFLAVQAQASEERAVKARVAPVYPEIARRLRIGGTVVVRAIVEPDGKVSDARTLTGNRMLSPAAEEAVRKWKFVVGQAASTVDVEVNFGLTQ